MTVYTNCWRCGVVTEDIHPQVAQKLLKVFLAADLHYQLSGTPHHAFLERQIGRHRGQARRLIRDVVNLGPDGARRWLGYFIEGMAEEG